MTQKNDTIQIGSDTVHMDPDNLKFNEATLTTYLQKEGGFYNNFGAMLARAEYILQHAELEWEALYGQKFRDYKDEGGSDKYAEARTDSDDDVVEAKKKVVDARFRVRLLTQHLRAWDKNHENAQSLGHFLRKEMDKLGTDVIKATDYSVFDEVDKIVKAAE
jgi:hypothetical protein